MAHIIINKYNKQHFFAKKAGRFKLKRYFCNAKIVHMSFNAHVLTRLQRIKMEIYEAKNNYQIVGISRSNESLSVKTDNIPDDVMLSFLPYLILDVKNMIATTILTSQFVKKDKKPLSNELVVRVTYQFSGSLPIVQDGVDKVKIHNYEDLLSIFDTSIGIFRGILFEWLKGSSLQHPLPAVHLEEFLKGLRISFSK